MTARLLWLAAVSAWPALLVGVLLAIAWIVSVALSLRRPARLSGHDAPSRPGGNHDMKTKPAWDTEELRLLELGYTPRWDAEEERLAQALCCVHDGSRLAYVGLARGPISLVFGVCPTCQRWVSYQGAQP